MSERTYCIIGTGALGGYYGARLHHGGNPVGFLLRSDFQHVREHGLKVESKHGDFSIAQPRIYASPAEIEPADVAVVSLKTTHNHLLPAILPHAVKPSGMVLVMQNGLNVEADVAAVLPDVPIVSGLAFLCSNKIGPGHIRHLDYGQVRLGQWSAEGEAMGVTQLVRDIAADFQRAGLRVELEEDLLLARWKKLVWNVPFNGLSVMLNAATDQLMGEPHTRDLAMALMEEVAAGAQTMGRTLTAEFLEAMVVHTDQMIAYQPSMLLDWQQGRPLEVEAIYGNPLRAAAAKGVKLPRIEMLYQMLKAMEAGRAS